MGRQTERVKGKWYERTEIEKVTLDWVKTNCNTTKREMELLQLVYDRKLVRRDHLEIICESYRHSGNNSTRLVNRAIKKLYQNMILDKIHERQKIGKGNTPCIVALDKGGSVLLGIPHKRRIAHEKSVVNGKTYIRRMLPANYRHINGINQIEVDTILYCEETGSELIQWVHEKPYEFHYGQEKVKVIPDVGVKLKLRDKPFYAFLEYDTGSENRGYKDRFPTILEKIVKYRRFKRTKVWEEDYNIFPTLLFVTEDNKRIPFFHEKCRENSIEGFGIYHRNFKDFLEYKALK